jgi:hypothetical protein
MYYSVVYFLNIDKSKIDGIRKKYDPTFNLIDAHMTIVFPVPDSISEEEIIRHINNKLAGQKSFNVHISGFEKSWDNWLFLCLKDGRSEMVKLHDKLYKGILAPLLRKDIEYIPHISLGLFSKKNTDYDLKNPTVGIFDDELYGKALGEAGQVGLDYKSIVNKVSLIKIDDAFTKVSLVHEFPLN